ncbi:hypothetical protein LCM17_13390 [Cereibacter sphaeroides]|nr:hypothetical protein [Cereibacter sphaeroides]
MSGGAGRDTIWLYAFRNEVDAGDGNDTVHSSEGEDTIHGGAGNDELYTGYNQASELFGDDGDDILISSGISSGNVLHGGDGDDRFTVSGSDTVFGDAGNDTIWIGRLANDNTPARVWVDGGDGEDVIVSNGGDTLTGGADADQFELDVLHEGPDGPDYIASTITDYTTGEDTIVIPWDDGPLPEVTTAFNDDGSALQILLDGAVVAELTGVTSFDPDTLVFERA